jgi:hypothetical protein
VEKACRALWNIAGNADNKVKVAGAGGIEAVVEAMRDHASNASVVENACDALAIIAWSDDAIRTRVADKGGIELLQACLKKHSSSVDVHKQACSAIHRLSLCTTLRPRLVRNGVVPVLEQARSRFPSASADIDAALQLLR